MATGSPNFAITPNTGAGAVVSIGDASHTAPVNFATVLSAGASGSRIERLAIAALGSTSSSVLRLFLYDGSAHHLYYELAIPPTTMTAGAAAWNMTLEAVTVPNLMPLLTKTGWSLRASVNDTQIQQETNAQSIGLAQTVATSPYYLALNGTNVTAGAVAGIAVSATPTSGIPMTMTATPFVMTAPGQVTLTSASNDSAVNFLIMGRDATGAMISETLAGPNANTVYSVNVYKTVYEVVPTSSGSALSVGYSTVAGTSVLPLASKIMLFSGFNQSAINFTITGTSVSGQVQSEVLAGPNIGIVQSVNVYTSITSIKASGVVTNNMSVGNPTIMSGISVMPVGGDF